MRCAHLSDELVGFAGDDIDVKQQERNLRFVSGAADGRGDESAYTYDYRVFAFGYCFGCDFLTRQEHFAEIEKPVRSD